MIKWLINWIASVSTMHLFAVFLGSYFGNHTPIIPSNTAEATYIAIIGIFTAIFGVFFATTIRRWFLGEAQFKYVTSIMISVFLSVSASVLIAYLLLSLASIT